MLIVDAVGHTSECYEPSSGEVRSVDVAALRRARLTGLGYPHPFAFVLPIRMYDRTVGELQSIGYTGQPVQQAFRRVDPPIAVLVDLAAVFAREPHRTGGYNPAGLQMHSVVEGRLTCWGICEQGHWWGLVTYDIAYGARRKAVTHWIPAWTIKRKSPAT